MYAIRSYYADHAEGSYIYTVNGGFPTAFVPGQAEILVYGGNLSNSDDIALVSLDGSDEVTPLLHTSYNFV